MGSKKRGQPNGYDREQVIACRVGRQQQRRRNQQPCGFAAKAKASREGDAQCSGQKNDPQDAPYPGRKAEAHQRCAETDIQDASTRFDGEQG